MSTIKIDNGTLIPILGTLNFVQNVLKI